jgi:hypothetical protein
MKGVNWITEILSVSFKECQKGIGKKREVGWMERLLEGVGWTMAAGQKVGTNWTSILLRLYFYIPISFIN